jgi:hypothetical protein
MGILAKDCLRLTLSCGVRAESRLCLRAGLVIEGYAAQLRQFPWQERSAFQIGTIDRPCGAGAGIAARRTETEHDHGERQWKRHDVSQENG